MKSHRLLLSAAIAAVGFTVQNRAEAILLSAENFAVLGASTVTSTGGSVLNGDLGVYPGSAITGFPPGIVNGTTYFGGTVAQQAQADALAAFNLLSGEAVTMNLTGQNLGGLTLLPGVLGFDTSAQLTGILILDAQGDINARFDFLIGSTLTTASSSSVLLINGASANNVFWQIGSSATLGTGTSFLGSIIADQSVMLTTGASLVGRAVALNGAVTLDNNLISVSAPVVPVPEPAMVWAGVVFSGCIGWGLLSARRRSAAKAA